MFALTASMEFTDVAEIHNTHFQDDFSTAGNKKGKKRRIL